MNSGEKVCRFAYQGNWSSLMGVLRDEPWLVNHRSPNSRYTPLSQAAWHGAPLEVIAELLALRADKRHVTAKGEIPLEIARRKHQHREDLEYALAPSRRTVAQLLRKTAADIHGFYDYDGNQIILDRMVAALAADENMPSGDTIINRFSRMFYAVTSITLDAWPELTAADQARLDEELGFSGFQFNYDKTFWRDRFLPCLERLNSDAEFVPLEWEWAVVSDLFSTSSHQWGLRGDPFLWLEIRGALCHVSLPDTPKDLAECIKSEFRALTGICMKAINGYFVMPRLQRGGMSSGAISKEFWELRFLPLMIKRYGWLRRLQYQSP